MLVIHTQIRKGRRFSQIALKSSGRDWALTSVRKCIGYRYDLQQALGAEAVLFTANTLRGDVAKLNVDFGQNQISETGLQWHSAKILQRAANSHE